MTTKKTITGCNIKISLIDEPSVVDLMDISAEGVNELAQSISEMGLLQAVLLRRVGERFEVIAGHRRFLAHKQLGLLTIRADVKEMSDEDAALARATENLGRINLTPIEEARVYHSLINDHGLSYEAVSKKFGKSAGVIKRRADLLRMPPQLIEAVHSKAISIAVAEELWPITDIPTMEYYLSFAVEGGCTRNTAKQWRKDWKDSERRLDSDIAGGVESHGAYEPRPIYVSCALCTGPMEIGKETVLRL